MHRQGGKTKCLSNIIISKMMDETIENPTCILGAAQLNNLKKVYVNQYLNYAFGNIGGTFNSQTNVYFIKRNLKARGRADIAQLAFVDGNERSKADRGLTGHLLACDELGDCKDGFLESVLKPMGYATDADGIFCGTPRGPNHFKESFYHAENQMLKGNDDYFALKWTIEDALDAKEITQKKYDSLREEYKNREREWKTEYLLDFNAAVQDRAFADNIERLKREGKNIGLFPINSSLPTDCFWDIGCNGTAVWFRQQDGFSHKYIRYMQQLENVNFQKFVREKYIPFVMNHGLNIRYNVFPHDVNHSEWLSEESRLDVARQILKGEVVIRPSFKKMDEAVDKVNRHFDRCFFDYEGCYDGIVCLEMSRMLPTGKIDKGPDFVKYSHGTDAFILAENFEGEGDVLKNKELMGVDVTAAYKSFEKVHEDFVKNLRMGKDAYGNKINSNMNFNEEVPGWQV